MMALDDESAERMLGTLRGFFTDFAEAYVLAHWRIIGLLVIQTILLGFILWRVW